MLLLLEYILKSKDARQSHLSLTEECLERGGVSTNHRGVLAGFLNTDFPKGNKIHLCHACHNDKCSNPKHLYWGTAKENFTDAVNNGTVKSVWDNTVSKYGLDKAKSISKSNGFDSLTGSIAGKVQTGTPKTDLHKRKISEALKK